MTDRTTQLRLVYGVLFVGCLATLWLGPDNSGSALATALTLFVLMLLLWPSVKPGVRTHTSNEEGVQR